MEPFFDLVLIGENAACVSLICLRFVPNVCTAPVDAGYPYLILKPHCSSGGRVLKTGDMILIDVGAHLYGLSSDVCRTFLLPHDPSRFQHPMSSEMKRKFAIWSTVLDAQTASIEKMVEGSSERSRSGGSTRG